MSYRVSFFFFFQAEDGIRDRDVTGVQTCALPIYRPAPTRGLMRCARPSFDWDVTEGSWAETMKPFAAASAVFAGTGVAAGRSEERRVGKDGRSRWGRWHG